MTSVPRIAVLLAAGSIALFGCGQEPGTSSGAPESVDRGPSDLARQGLFEEAAAAWLAEADEAPEPESGTLRLRAAEAWWKAGHAARAGETAGAIDPATLSPSDASRRALVLARAALARGEAGEAFVALPSLEAMLALPKPAGALELAVRVARQTDRAADEIRFRIALDPRLARPEENRRALWALLRALPDNTLGDLGAERLEGLTPGAGGWLELERHARNHRADFAAFSTAIGTWRERHPGHPAEATIVPPLLERIRRSGLPPSHVALMLPLSGTFASAATAVRDGFFAGWYSESGVRPVVSVYDTGSQDPVELFRSAVAQGADFVVGPLAKKAIGRIASLSDRGVPALLLNVLEGGGIPSNDGPPVYRFALSPEDEARGVSERARRDGYARAGVIVPETAWGKRVAEAFTRHWEESGGVVAARARYRGAAEDLAQPVRALLDIDASEERARKLRRTLRRAVSHEAFPRGDLDFVFLAGFPREARLLRPQITFLRAPDLPVYSTSHVFGGIPQSPVRSGSRRNRIQRHAVGAGHTLPGRHAARANREPVAGGERRLHPLLRIRYRRISTATAALQTHRPPRRGVAAGTDRTTDRRARRTDPDRHGVGTVPKRLAGAVFAVTAPRDRSTRGRWAEELAARHLVAHGLVCRDRNFRSKFGEIDLVMNDGATVVFVEVRSRSGSGFMDPAESVDWKKRTRIARTADTWLRARGPAAMPACRFDVVSVTGDPEAPDIRWVRGAFDA